MRVPWDSISPWTVTLFSIIIISWLATPCYGKAVTLAWDENAEPDLTGYKIYYKTGYFVPAYDGTGATEGDSPITIPLEELNNPDYPEYTINILDDNEIWFFVVTAYDTEGLESAYSNQVFFDNNPPNSIVTSPIHMSIIKTISSISGIYSVSTDFELEQIQIMVTDGATYLQADDTWTTMETWFTVDGRSPTSWTHDVNGVAFTTNTTYTVKSRLIDNDGNIETQAMEIQFTYDSTNPSVANSPFIDFNNNTVDITFSEDNMQNTTVEANYSFDPSLNFANPGGSDDIANISGSTYRLAMASIPGYTIYTLTISNITDAAGNEVSPSSIKINDNDLDRMPDDWEATYGVNDPKADPDGDGLINLVEYVIGTNPLENNQTLPDLDGDGMPDIWEQANGLDLNNNDAAADPDHDFLNNEDEYLHGTDPWMTDSDRDGIGGGTEVAMATDALDPSSVPEISLRTSRLRVTDVTPRSFSLVWVANQAATCFANVYTDPEGNSLIKDLTITDQSANHPPAGENGVMKVSISGLAPDTTYYFRIVTVSSQGVLVEPASGELPSVRTEVISKLVNNDLLAHRILQSDGTTPAVGALLLAEVQGGSYPITGWVDDEIPAPWAYVDLNNIYSQEDRMNLELVGGEDITLVSIGGFMGYRRLNGAIPAETGGIQTLEPEPNDDQCTLDTAGPIIDTDQLDPAPGAFINDNTPVISGSYSDEYSEIDTGSVRLVVDGVEVTDQATVGSTDVAYTPSVPLSEGSHGVSLYVSDEWGYLADPFSWNFTVDVTAPVVIITQPQDGDYLYPALQPVRWSIDEENLLIVFLLVNDRLEEHVPEAFEAMVALDPGLNIIEIFAVDQVNNMAGAAIQVTLDGDFDGDGIVDYYDADDDNDLMPDSWELPNGFDPFDPFDARLDDDGDGHANLTEYTAGTDPQDPENYPIVTLAVDHITVTDVTSEGFSVIWQISEPSISSLEVFDEMGILLGNLEIVSESALYSPAEDIGVMKVRVSGLEANKTYGFQVLTISKADGLALFTPVYPQVLEVVTETADSVVVNDPIKQMIYDEDGSPVDGALLVASVTGGDYPVTAWVGQDIASPWARVDLDRIYSELTHENLQLLGGEELTLWSFGGQLGNYVNIEKIPPLTGDDQVALPDASYLSRELGHYLDLKVDLNLVGLPVHLTPALTSHSLLLYVKEQASGDASVVENIKRYNRQTGTWEKASWFLVVPAGVDFAIKAGEAYLIYMKQDMDDVWFEGMAHGAAIDLAPGLNLVCLPAAREEFQYSSYEMLEDLGDESQVSSIRRYDPTGWQTTSWFMGSASGAEYNTIKGEGYLIYMNQEKLNWRPY